MIPKGFMSLKLKPSKSDMTFLQGNLFGGSKRSAYVLVMMGRD